MAQQLSETQFDAKQKVLRKDETGDESEIQK